MLKIGLTGGIGSGKTTVANLFATLNVPIIDADEIAHTLTAPHTPLTEKLTAHFGKRILNSDHTLNRNELRKIVFANETQRKWLEQLLHPLILNTMQEQLQKIHAPYCLLVIPLLAETTNHQLVDRILVVDTSEALQIARTQERSHLSEAEIRAIMHTQASRDERLALADDVILNEGDIPVLQNQVFTLHSQYLKIAQIE